MNTKHKLKAAAAALLLGISTAASADCTLVVGNLIVNCGFEASPTAFTGWTVSGVDTTTIQGQQFYGIETVDPFPLPAGTAPDGGLNQVYVTDPYNTLTLAQTLATSVGATYTVSFALAQYPVDGSTLATNSLKASFGGTTLTTLTNSAAAAYKTYTFDVAATGASTTFSLASTNLTGEWLIDDVTVTADVSPVPETSTPLLMAAGLLAMGYAARRKRL